MRILGTLVFITLISLVGLELICGVAYTIRYGRHLSPWFGGPPLQTLKFKDDYDFDTASIWTNRVIPRTEGLFAKESVNLPPKGNDYWVFLTGGSTVANVRKPLGDRLSDHIERNLGQIDGRKVRVFNFGVPSYATFNQLSLLVGKLLAFHPDMVIAYDGVNDARYGALTKESVWRQNFSAVAAAYRQRFIADINLQQNVRQRLVSLLRAVSYSMFLADEITRGAEVRQIRDLDSMTPNEFSSWYASTREKACNSAVDGAAPHPGLADHASARTEAAAAYVQNITAMQAATEAIGAKFVHVLQPTALHKAKTYPCEEFSFRWNGAAYRDFKREMSKQYDMFSDAIAQTARKQKGGIYIDLSHATDDTDEYLYDDWHHANPTGRLLEIVGRMVAADILKSLKN